MLVEIIEESWETTNVENQEEIYRHAYKPFQKLLYFESPELFAEWVNNIPHVQISGDRTSFNWIERQGKNQKLLSSYKRYYGWIINQSDFRQVFNPTDRVADLIKYPKGHGIQVSNLIDDLEGAW